VKYAPLARYLTGVTILIASSWAFSASAPTAPPLRLPPLGAGDSVSIQVYGQPDMSTVLYVGNDGAITVPLAGAVQVAGLTPIEAARQVEAAFRRGKFLRDPHVAITVVVASSQKVTVLGEVHHPGRYPINPSMTVLDLLAEAGGTTEESADVIYVSRQEADGKTSRYTLRLKGLRDPASAQGAQTLQGGDSILVPVAEQFYIYGEVTKPNKYRLELDLTVTEAVALAGGLTRSGSERRIQIKRLGKDGRYVILHAAASDRVLANDVILVRQSLF
jgi:polysaccharide export outer membrane protein